jgi:hypothetical protein
MERIICMSKKLIAACMAIVAFAVLAMASTASAKPVLTQPTGTVLADGTSFTATNVNETIMTTGLGNVTCTTATLTGKLTKNNTAEGIEGNVEGATIAGTGEQEAGESAKECTSWTGGFSFTPNPATNGLPWCMKATEANDNLQIRGNSCAHAARPIRFTLKYTSGAIGTCTYQRTEPLAGTLRTDLAAGEDATFTITAQSFSKFEGGFGCPSSGSLDMSFTVTPGGSAVFASA